MQVMVPYRYELFVDNLISLVKKEEIPMERIDDAVERILRVKFIAGLFEFPFTDRSLLDTIGCMVTFAVFSTWCIGILACF
jgi:beta-glucosidase